MILNQKENIFEEKKNNYFIDILLYFKFNSLSMAILKASLIFQSILIKFLLFFSIILISAIIYNLSRFEQIYNLKDKFINQKCGDLISNEIFFQIGDYVYITILYNYQMLLYSIILCSTFLIKILI